MVVPNTNLSSSNVADSHNANGGIIIGSEAVKEKGSEPNFFPPSPLEETIQTIDDSKALGHKYLHGDSDSQLG